MTRTLCTALLFSHLEVLVPAAGSASPVPHSSSLSVAGQPAAPGVDGATVCIGHIENFSQHNKHKHLPHSWTFNFLCQHFYTGSFTENQTEHAPDDAGLTACTVRLKQTCFSSCEGAAAHQERRGAGGAFGGRVSGKHRAEVQSGLRTRAPGTAGAAGAAPQPAGTLSSTATYLCVCACVCGPGFGGIVQSAAKQAIASLPLKSLLAKLDSFLLLLVQFRVSVSEESGIWHVRYFPLHALEGRGGISFVVGHC